MESVISVRVLDAPFHIDKDFDYDLPPHIGACPRGTLVRVPFCGGNRLSWGVVTGEGDPGADVRRKSVISKLDDRFALDEEMLGLCRFLCDYYLCSFGDAVRCILPPALLSAHGLNIRYTYLCALTASAPSDAASLRSPAHRAILAYLAAHGETPREDLCRELNVTSAQIKALCEKGYVALRRQEELRNPYAQYAEARDASPIHLSRAQTAAYDQIAALYDAHTPRAALLHGVTGSGKTKIMLSLIDRVLADGRGVILMVPEIALTPQTVHIFCARYGERVAVIHSSLSAGERFDAWRRISSGQVDLVIGTRSAVFAPLKNLGLMIVDEEHEHTYKSEQDPKYHTRQICSYRAGVHNALVLLASATPSFESYYKAKKGQYTLVELKERFGGAKLPEAEIVDMREELRAGNLSPMSRTLFSALEETGERGEQAILFLNRRGYNASLQCKNCGEVLACPHCSVALTYHTTPSPRLMCHLCGYRAAPPRVCPSCASPHISYVGFGTQKVETELSAQLPEMRVLRMDADTTGTKQAYDTMLDGFRRGEADILLGTQMVTKGHDFPRVTLVGVLLADMGMYVNDFRASERTFSLLTQVIGRAGRAEAAGRAVIQTFSPTNEVIELAKRQDYCAFYNSEIQLREKMCFPPFCDMVQLTLTSPKEKNLFEAAKRCADMAVAQAEGDFSDVPLQMFGPMEAQVYKQAEQYRLRLMFKCRWNARTRELFRLLLTEAPSDRSVTVTVDINPLHS